MKTLLLADIPPCSNYTGGIVVAQMCRFIPEGELAIFCVLNKHLAPASYSDLAHHPIKIVPKPSELPCRTFRGVRIGALGAWAVETARRSFSAPELVRQAVEYGRAHAVNSVWTILEGQTIVRMAGAVAGRLGVPLRTQVWDPLDWWLDAHQVDRMNRRWDKALFDRTMRRSTACAAASWEMAKRYSRLYSVKSSPVISSLDRAIARRPEPRLWKQGRLTIGMAGQFYAEEEWGQLIGALNEAGWRVGDREVFLRIFAQSHPQDGIPPDRLSFMGWQPQDVVVADLSNSCDILYCPYPFASRMEEVSALSFPSKIVTYLAAGRPILFHGPDNASPAKYLRDKQAGLVCGSQDAAAVYESICRLSADATLYESLGVAAQQAFLADFTLDQMRTNVRRFLGYED